MPSYYVNRQPQSTGEHEVHEHNCPHGAAATNRADLGFHTSCHTAVTAAGLAGFKNVDGCGHCCAACNTR